MSFKQNLYESVSHKRNHIGLSDKPTSQTHLFIEELMTGEFGIVAQMTNSCKEEKMFQFVANS